MKYVSRKQQQAVMMRLKGIDNNQFKGVVNAASRTGAITKRERFKIMNHDTDKDGVKNKNDCRPFDKNKQGTIHDLRKEKKALDTIKKELQAKKKDIKKKEKLVKDIAQEKQDIKELEFDMTKRGKAINKIRRFLDSPSTRKTIKNIKKKIF